MSTAPRKIKLTPGAPDAPIAPQQFKDWREEQRWRQIDAAAWLGYSERTYQKWEQGETAVPKNRVSAIRRQMELAKARRRRA